MWSCYLLATMPETGSQKTYVGVTLDLDRRLRQHNGALVGGAQATKGREWERIGHVRGFPDHQAALQFEWRWKSLSRRKTALMKPPLHRRLEALQELLALDRPTTKAVPYASYETPLEFVVETTRDIPVL